MHGAGEGLVGLGEQVYEVGEVEVLECLNLRVVVVVVVVMTYEPGRDLWTKPSVDRAAAEEVRTDFHSPRKEGGHLVGRSVRIPEFDSIDELEYLDATGVDVAQDSIVSKAKTISVVIPQRQRGVLRVNGVNEISTRR
jgi:hypothetical protein